MSYQRTGSVGLPESWWRAVLIDVQFWVPFVVLVIGLMLLYFVQ